MSANAVVAGSLAEIKFIKTRSVCVLCIELPIENAEDAISKFGIPLPGQEIPVAVARLFVSPVSAEVPEIDEPAPIVVPAKPVDPGKSERAKEVYRNADERTQAAMRAGRLRSDHGYQNFLSSIGYRAETKDEAAIAQHRIFGVKSSVEFQTDDDAYQRFLDHEHQYAVFTGREPAPR